MENGNGAIKGIGMLNVETFAAAGSFEVKTDPGPPP
jgi:hypothetical protein